MNVISERFLLISSLLFFRNNESDKEADAPEICRKLTPISRLDTEGEVEVLLKVYYGGSEKYADGGKFSQYLSELQIGDGATVSGPVQCVCCLFCVLMCFLLLVSMNKGSLIYYIISFLFFTFCSLWGGAGSIGGIYWEVMAKVPLHLPLTLIFLRLFHY